MNKLTLKLSMAQFYRKVNKMVKRMSVDSEEDNQDIRRESTRSGQFEGQVDRSVMRGDCGEGTPRGSLDQAGPSRIKGPGNSNEGLGSLNTFSHCVD